MKWFLFIEWMWRSDGGWDCLDATSVIRSRSRVTDITARYSA
jgi:hypothetical protein